VKCPKSSALLALRSSFGAKTFFLFLVLLLLRHLLLRHLLLLLMHSFV
jgi:hypothetical protein